MDAKIMKTLKALANVEELNDANDIIEKHNMDKAYLGNQKTAKNHWRKYVPWLLKNWKDKKKFDKILTMINDIYKNLYKNNYTLDSIFSKDVRKPILDKYGIKSAEYLASKKLTKISYKEKGALIEEQKKKVYDRNSNRIEFESEDIMDIIKDNINSEDPMRIAIALLISCGSRPIELFERATYSPDTVHGDNWIRQDYVAKRKQDKEKPLFKPLIYLKADQFVEKVYSMRVELRKKYSELVGSDGNLKSTLSQSASVIIKSIFDYREDITLYTCRKIYGIVSYELFSKTTQVYGKNPSYNVWLNNVLGHSKSAFMTSHNYSHVELTKENLTPEHLAIQQNVLEAKIENIEERLDQEEVPQAPEKPLNTKITDKDVLNKFKQIKKIFDEYKKKNKKKPNQTELEQLASKVSTRSVIRLFYKEQKYKD